MNGLYFIVMGYIVISALRGYHRGFIRVIFSVASLVATIFFVVFTAPYISRAIYQNTPLYGQLETGCEKLVRAQIERKLDADDLWLDGLQLPEEIITKDIRQLMKGMDTKAIAGLLEENGIYQKIAKVAAGACVSVLASLIAFAVISVILYFIRKKLNFITKLPGVNLLNMIMGFFAGIVKAFIVIWLFFLIIKYTAMFPASAALIQMIEKDAVLKSLYDQNQIVEWIKYIPISDISAFFIQENAFENFLQ